MTPDEIDALRKDRGLSIRAAAKLAGISEGRWRQIVAGVMKVGGVEVPVNPKPSTLKAMQRAVQHVDATPKRPMSAYSDDELVSELRERLRRRERSTSDGTDEEKSAGGLGAATEDPVLVDPPEQVLYGDSRVVDRSGSRRRGDR